MPSPEDMEVMLALMRARQKEEYIRRQTRLLDQGQSDRAQYKEDARKLSDAQNQLARDIRPLERKVSQMKQKRFIEKIGGEMMNAAVYLKRPQTDYETIAIETEIIELLSQSIKSAGECAGSAGKMMMQAMMGMVEAVFGVSQVVHVLAGGRNSKGLRSL